MIVRLPNGDKVEVSEEDVPAFERVLKKMFAQPKEKSMEDVMRDANAALSESLAKTINASTQAITASIRAIKPLPFPEQQMPEQIPPVVSVCVEDGSITRDRKTGLITGLRLVVER